MENITELTIDELDEIAGGLPILIPAVVWATMEGVAVGATIYAAVKVAVS